MTEEKDRPGSVKNAKTAQALCEGASLNNTPRGYLIPSDGHCLVSAFDRDSRPFKALSFVELLGLLDLTGDEFIAICHRPVGGQFTANVIPSGRASEAVQSLPKQSCVWFSPNPTAGPERQGQGRGRERDVTRWAALYADLDVKPGAFSGVDQAQAFIDQLSALIGSRPSAVICSGHGLQPLWPLEESQLRDEVQWARAYQLIRRFGRLVSSAALNFCGAKVDSVFDLSRVLRVPVTLNCKNPDHPVLTSALSDSGGPLTLAQVEEFLDAYGAVGIESDQPVGGEILSTSDEWDFGAQDCAYAKAMVVPWNQDSDRPTKGRHPWAMNKAVRLAAAYRRGCLTKEGLIAALEHLQSALNHWCSEVGEFRPLHHDEVGSAFRWAVTKVATFTDEQVDKELGWHSHSDPQQPSMPQSFEDEVNNRLNRLRVDEAARKLFAREKAGPATVFDAGTLGEVLARPEQPPWRIEGLLPADSSALVVAQRKTGKTVLTLNLARSLLTGEPFLGRFACRAITGRVAILNFEVSAIQLAWWADQVGIPRAGLFLVNLRGQRSPLTDGEDWEQLAELLRKNDVESLIVDPFGRAYRGKSQNDTAEVGSWLENLEAIARTQVGARDLILTAHAGWQAEHARGASALEDWPDSIITMTLGADKKSRYLRAIGRDVGVDEDKLHFDPETKLLTMTGEGSRKEANHASKADALIQPVCEAVRARPGASLTELRKAVRDLRSTGDVDIAFQDHDIDLAIKLAERHGLRRVELGRGRPTKHYLSDHVQAEPTQPAVDMVENERSRR